MPSASEHQNWGRQNKQFYDSIGGSHSQWPDWAMTALFYAAMHEVQAALVSTGLRPREHKTRKAALREKTGGWLAIAQLYESLFSQSCAARYECHRHSQLHLALAEHQLGEVQNEIAKLSLPPY